LDVILGYIEKNRGKFEGGILADLGCGLGELAEKFFGENGKLDLFKKIYSYDLKSTKPWIEEVDIADLGFGDGEIQTAVFCLSLMGPNYLDFLKEATRYALFIVFSFLS
jgi:ribosomal RNA-processing protein 8